ncbi:IclR family transcriptional regulator [Salinirubellus salinus]|uniref:IclR family transcriptional regulator n=1 Tax=Salinirubellus salinus TaxID=1364945 RepID=A0A9E7UAN2_9EURY|nr:IclR family transcriptional regulator [Salinirubellus salinus]UWM54423.1 IclR family transcriptional regulator [Salinirubellus salinus]
MSSGRVKSAGTLFAVVEGLVALDGAGVSELAEHLGIAKSTAHRHLTTLEQSGYLVREGNAYNIGLKFLQLGEYSRHTRPGYNLTKRIVDEIAQETEERSVFMVEEHGEAVYLYRGIGPRAVTTDSTVGTRRPIHTIAGGKAILSQLPEERVEAIIEKWGLEALTKSTITSREVLYEELDAIREQGVAYNRAEAIEGLNAVAVPVTNGSSVVGALSVSGPANRLQGEWFEDEIPDLLLGFVNELELNLAHGTRFN